MFLSAKWWRQEKNQKGSHVEVMLDGPVDGTAATTFPFCKTVKSKGERIHVKQWDTSFLHSKYGPQ